MEGLEKIGVKLYNDSSEAEKEKISEIFRGIDCDGDGKVRFEELKECGLFTNELSFILDRFGQHLNGVIDFDGFLIFFLHTFGPVIQLLGNYEPGPRSCDGCGRRQEVPDFSCFFCFEKNPKTYDLCYKCHERGVYSEHEHEEWCMLNHDSLTLLEFFRHGLISTHFVQMGTSKHLEIEPEELRIPFVLGKRSVCCLRLTNKSNDHVAVKLAGTKFSVSRIVMPPHSTKLIEVYMKPPQQMIMENRLCDMIYIYSVLVHPGFIARDLTPEMFNLESGKVEVCPLRTVYIYVPPSVVQEEEASILNSPTVNEFKEERTTCVPMNSSTWPIVEMITGNLLQIEPHELHFQFFLEGKVVLGKRSSCSLKLTNESAYHVAIRISFKSKQPLITDHGSFEVLLPHSTKLLNVYIKPPTKYPLECDDKVYVRSVIVSPGLSRRYITDEMFQGHSGNWVERCELSVVYVNVPSLKKGSKESVPTVAPNINEFKGERSIYVPMNRSTWPIVEMITGNLLQIEPHELHFQFFLEGKVVLGKRSSCSLKLTNESAYHVAIRISFKSKQPLITDHGSFEVLLPHSTKLLNGSKCLLEINPRSCR